MTIATLSEILKLVGELDDSEGSATPRERFRSYMKDSVQEIGQIRDYIQECLRIKGPQYNRALQDLVNRLGHFLGFEVTYGRYQGTKARDQIGFDGHWKSTETDFHLVVEVKTTETYSVKTATLTRYIDELISEKEIPDWGNALGLYVIGKPDPDLGQLQNAIIAEKRMNQLRIISLESLLLLAELMSQYDIKHEDILSLLKPSGPSMDSLVDLMSRLVAGSEVERQEIESPPETPGEEKISYWIAPVKSYEEETAEERILKLVGEKKIYAFGEKTAGKKSLRPGDWICFYASGNGVIAHAKAISAPIKSLEPGVYNLEEYPWIFRLDNIKLYLDEPIILSVDLRSELDAFKNRNSREAWSWFVLTTRKISEHDFKILTKQEPQLPE